MNYIKSTYSDTIAKSNFVKPITAQYQVIGNVVTCVLKVTVTATAWDVLRTLGKSYIADKTFVGIAKCSPNDTFDELKGRDIAEHKAFKQYYDYLSNIFADLAGYYTQASKCAIDFRDWARNKAEMQKELANKY